MILAACLVLLWLLGVSFALLIVTPLPPERRARVEEARREWTGR